MPRQINNWPRGLVDVTQMKDTRTFEVGEDIQATIESHDFFAASRLQRESIQSSISASGQSVSLIVPNGQLWLVYGVSCDLSAQNVGDDLQCTLQYISRGGVAHEMGITDVLTVIDTNQRAKVTVNLPRPYVMNAGDGFQVVSNVVNLAAAPNTFGSIRVTIARFGPDSTSVSV